MLLRCCWVGVGGWGMLTYLVLRTWSSATLQNNIFKKNVLNLEPSSWCGEPFSWPVYCWNEKRTRSHSSTYWNNWPSLEWVQSIHSKTARKPIKIDWSLLARFPMEVYQSPHSNSHEDNPPAEVAAKVKKKTKCAVCVLIDVIGKTTFSKKTCTAPQREGKKKRKTILNAHWIRHFLTKMMINMPRRPRFVFPSLMKSQKWCRQSLLQTMLIFT